MSRRNARNNRRGAVSGGGVAALDPMLTTPFAAYRGDVTDTATNFDWTDRTGNGHTLRQATVADKPSVVTPAEIGGLSALRFDGVSDFLAAIDAASVYAFLHNGSGMTVMALVIPRTALVTNESIVDTYTSGANTAFRLQFGSTASTARMMVLDNAGAFAVDANATSAFAVGTPVLLTCAYATAAYDLRVDNVSRASGGTTTPGANNPPAPLNVGRRANGTAFAEMDIAELVIWNRALNAAELVGVSAYFTARYGTP